MMVIQDDIFDNGPAGNNTVDFGFCNSNLDDVDDDGPSKYG